MHIIRRVARIPARLPPCPGPYTVEGRMNWSLVESRTQTFMDEYETQLKDITVGYLMDKEINRFHGVRRTGVGGSQS